MTAELEPRVGLWRILLALLLAGLFGVVAILPYSLTLILPPAGAPPLAVLTPLLIEASF